MKTILIVDDNEINRYLAAHVLEKRGFRVLQASDGVEALAQVAQHRPDVVVLDIQMPGLSGLEVLTQIRGSAVPEVARTPVIAATALAMAEEIGRAHV